MAYKLTVPRLGWSMDEGTFAGWLKSSGELVSKGDMVFEIESEKAVQEIESFDAGRLCIPSDAPKPGDPVRVGQVIGFLLEDGEPAPTSVAAANTASADTASADTPQTASAHDSALPLPSPSISRPAGPAARRLARQHGIDLSTVSTPDPTGRVLCEDILHAAQQRPVERAARPISADAVSGESHGRILSTPRARRRAGELGIDWRRVPGSGRGGRVRERDIVARAEAPGVRLPTAAAVTAPPTGPSAAFVPDQNARGFLKPHTGIRRTVSQRMLLTAQQMVPVTLTTKTDASAIVRLRNEWREANSEAVPGYNEILIRIVAAVLAESPILNCSRCDNGTWMHDDIHICMAVDTEKGLVAPVIRNADKLTLTELKQQCRRLIDAAETGRLTTEQLTGGTFTITNLGMFDIDAFTPIINYPQTAILGIGRILREPVVRDDQVTIGHTLTLSLTFDHRTIDGAPAARWLRRLSETIRAGIIPDATALP
ncbi:MAG: 2-oxo acid dehydrogenase subunit E2 [Planctomycetaceae bacterium]|nr:2-oxo acid dehydrogenase subunit E2 [Planctomycetaceae bacterium]